jgi:hypothetical protein
VRYDRTRRDAWTDTIIGEPQRATGGMTVHLIKLLLGRVGEAVREIADAGWERPAVGRPHALPLVVAVVFGLRHTMVDAVLVDAS